MRPVERQLRERLRTVGCTREEARRISPLAVVYFDRLLKAGACTLEGGGRARLKIWTPDPALVEAHARELERRRDFMERLAERQRLEDAARAERERREAEERALFADTFHLSTEERRLVVAERAAALRESRQPDCMET